MNFLKELKAHRDEEKICTNFGSVEFVLPFATLLLAIGLREFLRYRFDRKLKTTSKGQKDNSDALSYLKHLGFFKYIGLNEGKQPNEAPGGERYLPLTKLNEAMFTAARIRLQEAIDRESDRLSKIIYPRKEDEMRAIMISYCFREAIRNVFEHAEIEECFVLAQKWNNGFAEIAIADRGIGLFESLRDKFHVKDSREAIAKAILPGISSDVTPDSDDKWQNSGFGLYVLSELGNDQGEFALASDGMAMFRNHGRENWYSVPVKGTALKLRVNTNEADYWSNILNQIVVRGESMAINIPGAKRTASKMSKNFR